MLPGWLRVGAGAAGRTRLALESSGAGERARAAEEFLNRAAQRIEEPRIDEARQDLATQFFNRGETRRRKGELADALADLDKAVEFSPRNARYYRERAAVRLELGDRTAALADYGAAIEIDAKDAANWGGRGNCRIWSGDSATALQDLAKAIELNPDLAEAYDHRWLARRCRAI